MRHWFVLLLTACCICGEAETIVGVNFAAINLNQTLGLGTGATPPDMGMAVGSNQIVQMVNGAYEVFDKSGNAVANSLVSDKTFWTNALNAVNPGSGSALVSPGLSDPRVIYDQGSGRFFASEINLSSTGNQVLLAVSNTSNPSDGWKAVNFTGNSGFADFDTLGLDQHGVYVGTNNFANATSNTNTGVSVFSIPKADLIGGTPTLADMSSFQNLSLSAYGFAPNPAIDYTGSHGAIFDHSDTNFTQAELFSVSNSNTASASLSSPTTITGLLDGSPIDMRQPNGTKVVDAGDVRYGSTPFVVGNLMYATDTISDNTNPNLVTHDIVHWVIEDLNTHTTVAQGQISDPNFDFTYSSIVANANGDFVIAFDRSGGVNTAADNISSYAMTCHLSGTSVSCGNPFLLSQGLSGSFDLNNPVRWGDYSAITVDPNNASIFWAAVEVPIPTTGNCSSLAGCWSTQITQIEIVPEPGTFLLLGSALLLFLKGRRSA